MTGTPSRALTLRHRLNLGFVSFGGPAVALRRPDARAVPVIAAAAGLAHALV